MNRGLYGKSAPALLALVLIATVLLMTLALVGKASAAYRVKASGTRSFYMGFTPWPYAATIPAIEDTYQKIHQHGDLIAFHLDNGIPWPEAYAGAPFSADFENQLDDMVAHIQAGQRVYLGICPLNGTRDGLALYRGSSGGMPLPSPWNAYHFNDSQVIDAYSEYCRRLIERFDPRYLNFGIESTDLALNNPSLWPQFVQFIGEVHERIKEQYPNLMIGVSVGLRPPSYPAMTTVADAFAQIRDFVDYVGVSTYPYAAQPWGPGNGNPAGLESGWLSQIVSLADGKPIAVCETGFIAEDCVIPAYGWNIHGTEAWQNDYVTKLLTEADQLGALFVVWWCIIDFDRLWATFSGDTANVARIWRDTGLYTGDVVPRAGLATWDTWLSRQQVDRPPATVPAGGVFAAVVMILTLAAGGVLTLSFAKLRRSSG
jgi:hypothetical protein